jgi:hypothetical protein
MAWSSSSMAWQILLSRPLIADQAQRGLEIQSGGEDPVDHHVVYFPGDPIVIFGEMAGQFR